MNATGELCVIPARGGSRRIARKNVRSFGGVPAIARVIDTLLHTRTIGRIIVSTDDDEIAEIAVAAGAEVPFRRPAELASDDAPTAPVVAHAIAWLSAGGHTPPSTVWVVYPTAVLLLPDDIDAAAERFADSGARAAISVVRAAQPIERAWRRRPDGRGEMVAPDRASTRTQDLPDAFFDAGQFYVAATDVWASGEHISTTSPMLIELPLERAVDIDADHDVQLVERLLAARSGN